MALKPRKKRDRRPEIDETTLKFMQTGQKPEKDTPAWDFYISRHFEPDLHEKTWERLSAEILEICLKESPCQRPWAWWQFGDPEPRHRLGGVGDPAHEFLSYKANFHYGLPVTWITDFDVEYYNGKRRDINGKRIGTTYKEGNFKGKAIDPNDPPTFESEATYLKRLNFLTQAEQTYLKKHQELLEPEKIEI